MEKLEEILRAEEHARHLLRDAQDQAAEIGRTAAADAERIHAEAKNSGRRELAGIRTSTLAATDAEIERIVATSERELGDLVRAAESRLEDAVDAVTSEITG